MELVRDVEFKIQLLAKLKSFLHVLKVVSGHLKKRKKVLICSEIEQFPDRQEIVLGIASFGGVLESSESLSFPLKQSVDCPASIQTTCGQHRQHLN